MNDNEDTHYPLVLGNSVYPDNLVTGVRMLVPYDTDKVYVSYVSSNVDSVYIMFEIAVVDDGSSSGSSLAASSDSYSESSSSGSGYTGAIRRMAYSIWNREGFALSKIIYEDSSEIIGWVSWGSGTTVIKNYRQSVEVSPLCLQKDPYTEIHPTVTVNGISIDTPEVLRINFGGYIDGASDGTVISSAEAANEDMDIKRFENIGPITKINGAALLSDTCTLSLPKYTTPEGMSYDIFYASFQNSPANIITIYTNTDVVDYIIDTYGVDPLADFTCPSVSHLTSNILPGSSYGLSSDKEAELPLDLFLQWYTTVVINGDLWTPPVCDCSDSTSVRS